MWIVMLLLLLLLGMMTPWWWCRWSSWWWLWLDVGVAIECCCGAGLKFRERGIFSLVGAVERGSGGDPRYEMLILWGWWWTIGWPS
jgi:hypothetical protein